MQQNMVPLRGSEKAPVMGARAIAPADPSEHVQVTLILRSKPTSMKLAELTNMSAQHPNERSYLSREEFASVNGPTEEDIAKIEDFAHEHGLTIVQVRPESSSIVLSGLAGDISQAFGTQLSIFDSPKGMYRGRVGPVNLPAEIAPIVLAVLGLDNRPQAKPHFQIAGLEGQQGGVVFARAASSIYTPPQLAKIYNFPPGDGRGQCIGIIELGGGYRTRDLSAYFKSLGLASPKVSSISVDGGKNSPGQDADAEVVLDIEVAGAIAPKSKIAVYFAPNTDQGFIDAVNMAVHDKRYKPSVISISWGAPEIAWTAQAMQAMDQAFQAAAAMGVTILVASGDNGSRDGWQDDNLNHVDFPASSPYATGCGGTKLDASGEVVWNESANSATGGGVSDFFPMPDWQTNAKIPASANAGGHIGRGVPDLSGDADPQTGYIILLNGKRYVIGGTSAVAPLWAGLIAILNQNLGKPIGYLNPLMYTKLANHNTFRDITGGNNGDYSAGQGWDACTGWGSPDGQNLLQALKGP